MKKISFPGLTGPVDNAYPGGRDPSYIAPGPDVMPGEMRNIGPAFKPGQRADRPQPVREVNRYPTTTVLGFNPNGVTSMLAVNQPDTTRILLAFRAPSSNTVNVYIAFGREANTSTATLEIPPGGMIWLDNVIPQDDVWVGSAGGNASVVVTYANSNL